MQSFWLWSLSVLLLSTIARADEPQGDLAKRLTNVKFERYAEAPGYSEGPTWWKGEVFFCSGALYRIDAKQKLHKYLEINPAGTVLRGNGHLLVADNKHKAILDVDADGKVNVVVDNFEGQPLRGLNDLTVDARGNVYWTDPEGSSLKTPVGNLYRLRPDGRVHRIGGGLAFPNGIEVDPASKYLYVIESQSKKILRYPLPADDDWLGKPEVFYDLGGSGGDGCAFDAAGNLWVADFHRPDTMKGRITVLSPEAKVLAYLDVPAKVVSNIAFGGPDHDEIFCTTGDPPGVFHARVGVKGFVGHPAKELPTVRKLNVVAMKPHADAATLVKIVRAAADVNLTERKVPAEAMKFVRDLVAELTDKQIRADMERFLPQWEKAAVQYAHDRLLIAEIKRLGGKATVQVQGPNWLRAIVGDEAMVAFAHIVEIDLNERTDGHKPPVQKPLENRVTDDWLKKLDEQEDLRRLELSGTAVTSAGMRHLRGLELERLNVCLTAVDDEGLKHLTKMTSLKRLVVCSSNVTGTGFKHLEGMKQLESINLHSSPASDAGLEAIGKLTSLRRLEIVHTKVTDAGLKQIASLINLRQLHVASHETTENAFPFLGQLQELYQLDVYDKAASNPTLVQISNLKKLRFLMLVNGVFDDDGVRHLAKVVTLEELSLSSSKVTDASIEHLVGLKNLRKLNLSGTKITKEGRERLQKQLPKVEITP